jgi:hypothetical protein
MPTPEIITLEYLKRWPSSQRASKWRKKRVNIFTPGKGFWRPQAAGYTLVQREGWVIPFETAVAHTANISPRDHPIEFHLVDMPWNKL